jgi:uncharacterized protein YdeI (YjbR/CyaY-like superfamily)
LKIVRIGPFPQVMRTDVLTDKRLPVYRFAHVEVVNPAQLRDWLSSNYSQDESVWLVTFKKVTPEKYVSRQQVLDELLCFGWIDGVLRTLDDKRTMQLISPRRHQVWAKSYKDRAARLMAEGRMEQPGIAAIETSKARGLWDTMADVDALEVPEDLAIALSATLLSPKRLEMDCKRQNRCNQKQACQHCGGVYRAGRESAADVASGLLSLDYAQI